MTRAYAAPVMRGATRAVSGLGVDVVGALNLVGALVKYLGLAFLFPVAVAAGYGEAVWPFLLAGVLTAGFGFVLERSTRGQGERRRARGLSRGRPSSGCWWPSSARSRMSWPSRSSRGPSTRCSSRCRASPPPARASSPTSTPCRARWPCGGSSPTWIGGVGIIVHVPGRAAAAARRRSPGALQVGDARARDAAGDDDPRERAALRHALRRDHGARDRSSSRRWAGPASIRA